MILKNKPYWLRGGVIGLIVLVALYFLNMVMSFVFPRLTSPPNAIFFRLMTLIAYPVLKIINPLSFLSYVLILVIHYFIAGAIIGLIIKMIKKRG